MIDKTVWMAMGEWQQKGKTEEKQG